MKHLLFALALSMLGSAPALAQGAAGRLQTILSNVPASVMAGGTDTIVAGFGNGDAVRWIAVRGAQNGDNPDTPNRFAALRSAPPIQRAVIEASPDDALRAAIGLRASDWVETWEVAQGPVRVGAMDIFPDSEMRLRGALFSRGYVQEERAGTLIMWTGPRDFEPAPDRVDPAMPFGGDLGLPVRMAFDGNRAVWATGWSALDQVLSPGGATLAARADAQSVIAGLQRVGNLGGLVSVRAWLRNGAAIPVAGAETGPVEALALADYANRETEGAAMVLVFDETVDVTAMAQRLTDAWPVLSDLPSPAEPDITTGGNSVTVTMLGDWGDNAAEINDAYAVFESLLAGGRLGFLIQR